MFSPNRLIEAINTARSTELKTGYYRVQASEDLQTLLKILKIDWTKANVKYEDLKNFAKGWYTT